MTASNVTVPKYFLSADGDSGGEAFLGAATRTGDDGGQKPLSSARHMVPMANTPINANFRLIIEGFYEVENDCDNRAAIRQLAAARSISAMGIFQQRTPVWSLQLLVPIFVDAFEVCDAVLCQGRQTLCVNHWAHAATLVPLTRPFALNVPIGEPRTLSLFQTSDT